MLPHFPAILLLLVSYGGADHPPPWKDPPRSLPSPREPYRSNGDKHDQSDSLRSKSSTAPKIQTGGEVHSGVADIGKISSVRDAYGVLLTNQFTTGMPGDGHHRHTIAPMAPTLASNLGLQQRISLRPDYRPAFPLERSKQHPILRWSERRLGRSLSQTGYKTSTNTLIYDASRGDTSYGWEKVPLTLRKRCPTRRLEGSHVNDTSSDVCIRLMKPTFPFFGGIPFFSPATGASLSQDDAASQKDHVTLYDSRNLPSRKMTTDDLKFVFSGTDATSSDSPNEMNPPLRRASSGTETARGEVDTRRRSNLSYGVFHDVLNKNLFRGGAGPFQLRKEHYAPRHKSVVDGKGSDVAPLRREVGKEKSDDPGFSDQWLLLVTRPAKPHTSKVLRRSLSPEPNTFFESQPIGQKEIGKNIVNNVFLNKHRIRGEIHPSHTYPKYVNSWRKRRVRQKRKDTKILGTNGRSSKGSLFRDDRAEKETGKSKNVLRDQPREKRDAEEAQKNEIGLVNAQLGTGHSEMAVGQEEKQRSFHDRGRSKRKRRRLSESTKVGCKGNKKVACTADVQNDSYNDNTVEVANVTNLVNGSEPSWLEDENSSGNLNTFLYRPHKYDETVDAEIFRTKKNDESAAEVKEEPVMRLRRRRWSSITRTSPVRNHSRNHTKVLPTRYSRIFTKNFPQIFSNYHYGAISKHNHQSVSEQLAKQPASEGSNDVAVMSLKPDRKTARSLSPHANRSSVRAKGGSKHARGDRPFVKTPQQRHARSRNRAKRKVPAREVWAMAGDAALLPCDLSVRQAKDSVQMVMWLREGTHTPLFSVDYREQAGGRPQVWRDNTASTARRAYLHMADVDLGVTEDVSVGQDLRTRVMGTDYGDGTPPHIAGSMNFKFFGNRIEDISTLGKDLVGGSSSTEEDEVEEEVFGLVVRDVELNDSAIYRCRVDFLLSPTRNTRVNLTVVVPPLRVSVRWWLGDRGDSDIDGQVGPFREGDSPALICYTRDAWPPPRVVWFEEDALVDDSYSTDALNEAVENTLNLEHLTRAHHLRRFTCVAANSNLTRPIAATVRLQMALDVLTVQMDEVGVLSAGVQAEVKCTVWGSSPPPNVTWTLAGIILPSSKPWVSDDGNRSVSMVNFTPQPRHDGTQLECSAHNHAIVGDIPYRLPPADHRHSALLSINYAPRVSISLGRSLDASNIKEGDDLYFECSAIAKPPPHKVTWSHNGEPLDSSAGVLVSNMTLVLQKVSRSNAGSYTCHATNTEGSAASPLLHLDIKYAPVCASDKISQYSVAKQENARISCNVLANPPVVHFSWAFNNTAEAVSVPSDRYVVMGTESVVNYTPVTELDYGTLLCLATNDIGQQTRPCVFQIVAAGKPDPPHNCRAYDVTISSLQVSCLPGDDGGLGQTFLLQVLEANGDYKPVVEVTRESASFSVANLRPATAYRLLITATNAKGKSRSAELRAYTVALNHPQHETPAEPTRGRESGPEVAVGVLVGAVLACLPVAIAVMVVGVRTCIRLRAARRGRGEENEKEASEMEGAAGSTGRPLLTGQGTPGSVGGVSGEGGTDITTITGGVALASTLPPTPSSAQADARTTQVAATETSNLLYPGSRLYSPDRTQEIVGPPVRTLRRGPYNPMEEKFEGDNELLEITLPPPAAYDQGYQSSYQGGHCQPLKQCYQPQEHGPQRLKQNYQQVFQEYQPVLPGSSHLPATAYPSVPMKGGHPSLQYISSAAMTKDYHFPSKDPIAAANKVSGSSTFATLPRGKITASSSFATLPENKDGNQEDNRVDDPKMSTLYNPLALFASSPTYSQKCASVVGCERPLHTGSLKRGVKPQGQDVLRIRDNPRNRSASLSSVTSKRESSV